MKPLIVVTNDDGILARGISALVSAVQPLGEVIVCAPDTERSGTSHAITFHSHLRANPVREHWWSVSGTPVDCVYLAILHLCPRPPSLVVSGVNSGFNLGTDVFYSGTVGGAAQGFFRRVPAIAASTERGVNPAIAIPVVRRLAASMLALDEPQLLNVNVPVPQAAHGEIDDQDAIRIGESLPVEVTRLGKREYNDAVDHRTDPMGRPYYWIGGLPSRSASEPGQDTWAVANGIVSVTPLEMDITASDLRPTEALVESISSGAKAE